jgi:hypothetical protein
MTLCVDERSFLTLCKKNDFHAELAEPHVFPYSVSNGVFYLGFGGK